MTDFIVKDSKGNSLKFSSKGDTPPTETQIKEAFASIQSKPSLGEDIKDAFVGAGIETVRGFQEKSADMLRGTPLEEPIRQGAENLPETRLSPLAKETYQTIGKMPGDVAEFLVAGKAMSALKVPAALKAAFGDIRSTGQLGDAITIGVQSAINEFRNSSSYSEAANAFSAGATTSIGLGIAAEAVPKAIEIGKSMGKSAAKAFLKGVTGDEKFAEEFVKNPWKFNLNPFQKTPSLQAIEKENAAKIENLKLEYNTKVSDLKVQNAEKKAALSGELDREYFALRDKNKTLQRSLADKGKMDVERVHQEASKSFDNAVDLVHTGLLDDFNNTLTKVEAIKENYGKQVGQAVENITNKYPFSRIGMTKYLSKFKEVAERNGYKLVGGKVEPAFGQGTADAEAMRILQQNLDDIKANTDFSGVALGFAQKKKELWQKMGYSGESQANQIMRQLSGALNPVNMADDIVGKNIGAEINMLKSANAQYSDLVPKYEEAIKNFTRLDASGKPVADFQKVLNAVRNQDKTALKQIAKADSLLPAEDRLLPKAYEASRKLSQAETIKAANVKMAKRKANENLIRLNNEIRHKEFQVKQAQRAKRFDVAQRLQGNLNQLRTVEKAKLERTISQIESEQEFVRQQNIARSFTPPSTTRRTLQFGTVASAAGSLAANPPLALASGVGALALSPKVATGTIKTAGRAYNSSAEALKLVTELINSRLGKVIVSQAASQN